MKKGDLFEVGGRFSGIWLMIRDLEYTSVPELIEGDYNLDCYCLAGKYAGSWLNYVSVTLNSPAIPIDLEAVYEWDFKNLENNLRFNVGGRWAEIKGRNAADAADVEQAMKILKAGHDRVEVKQAHTIEAINKHGEDMSSDFDRCCFECGYIEANRRTAHESYSTCEGSEKIDHWECWEDLLISGSGCFEFCQWDTEEGIDAGGCGAYLRVPLSINSQEIDHWFGQGKGDALKPEDCHRYELYEILNCYRDRRKLDQRIAALARLVIEGAG